MYFPREMGLKRTQCDNRADYERYISKMADKTACFVSLYGFTDKKFNGRRMNFDYQSAIIDRAWWDFDGMNDPQVKTDAAELINRLEGTVLALATGRGFHVHQLLREPVREDRWPTELVRYEREMAKDLPTLDCIGTVDRLCRIPDTINPKRGRWCVIIDAKAFAADPHGYSIPKRPEDSLTHLNPFGKHTSTFSLVKWVHDNPPETVKFEVETSFGNIVGADTIPIMPCLDSIHTSNPTHHVRVALAQHLMENLRNFADPAHMTEPEKEKCIDQAIEFIQPLGWRDFKESITRKHLAGIVNMKGAQSCRWFVGKGMCKGKCWRYDGTVKL